ncbi:MAG: DUF5803 family protein [Halodesulfurarchaeum sp.]
MKRTSAVLGFLALLLLAGCTGGVVSDQALQESASYEWDTDATVTVTAGDDTYQAVYDLENQSEVELFHRDDLGGENPLPIRAIQFRYPNGTVVNASAMTVDESDRRTVVTMPQSEGKFAYTAEYRAGEMFIPVGASGNYEVILPPGARIGVPVIGAAEPAGYDKTIRNDRVHVEWGNPADDAITISYYFQRDLYIFAGLLGVLALLTVIGLAYFRLQIGSLKSEREAEETDVEP